MDTLIEELGAYGPIVSNTVKALAVLIFGWVAARYASNLARRRIMTLPNLDKTIGNFIAGMIRWVILLVVFIAILNLFGIQATSLIAILGAASLAIGLALQGTLSNVAAGFMLVLFRPYKLDQYVDIGGTSGTVKDLNLFFTELTTPDNVQIIVPNGRAWGAIITNYSVHDTRRVDLTFGIDYDDSADKAMTTILNVVAKDERALKDPEPWVRVMNLGESSVDLGVRVWSSTADYWELKCALTKAVKEAFDEAGISIPYPHAVEIVKNA